MRAWNRNRSLGRSGSDMIAFLSMGEVTDVHAETPPFAAAPMGPMANAQGRPTRRLIRWRSADPPDPVSLRAVDRAHHREYRQRRGARQGRAYRCLPAPEPDLGHRWCDPEAEPNGEGDPLSVEAPAALSRDRGDTAAYLWVRSALRRAKAARPGPAQKVAVRTLALQLPGWRTPAEGLNESIHDVLDGGPRRLGRR